MRFFLLAPLVVRMTEVNFSRREAGLYRAAVALQTAAWAVLAFYKVVTRQQRASMSFDRVTAIFALAAVIVACAGVASSFWRTPRESRFAVWLAGCLALTGYAMRGSAICFLIGVGALALMHFYSPNRLP